MRKRSKFSYGRRSKKKKRGPKKSFKGMKKKPDFPSIPESIKPFPRPDPFPTPFIVRSDTFQSRLDALMGRK